MNAVRRVDAGDPDGGVDTRVTASRMLGRLRAVDWDMRWDLACEHIGSRRLLMREYVRRAAAWASVCGAEKAWPFYDVTPYLDPAFELDAEQTARLEELLPAVPGHEIRRTCAGAVRLAELRVRRPGAVPALPDLYEPLVLFYERGGSFSLDCSGGFLDLVGGLYKPGPRTGFLHSTPVTRLDTTVLDALDAEGRITYYTARPSQHRLLRRRVVRDEEHDELFGHALCWEPTELPEGGTEAADLSEVDELTAAALIGTILTAAAPRRAGLSIQPGHPAVLRGHASTAADMADAVGELYSPDTEDAVLVWNGVPVRLSYAHDLAALLDDLVPLLEEVRRPGFSEAEVFWGSDTFSAEWTLTREDDTLRIRSRWHSTLGNQESLLAERGDAVVPLGTFADEWAKVLRRIVTDIDTERLRLEDDDLHRRAKTLLAACVRKEDPEETA